MQLRHFQPNVRHNFTEGVQRDAILVNVAQQTSPIQDADGDEIAPRRAINEIDETKSLSNRTMVLLFDDAHFIMVA